MKAYIIYRIALCIHLEVYLVSLSFIDGSICDLRCIQMLSMLILNETIRVDLIVFLAIFAECAIWPAMYDGGIDTLCFSASVATIAIAYDNAPYERKPVDWQLPKVWIISSVMGKGP